jgi:hypothetical protein
MINLTINQYTIQNVGFPMTLVLIYGGFLLFQNFRRKQKEWSAQQAQQEIHHRMITDIVVSNNGLRHDHQELLSLKGACSNGIIIDISLLSFHSFHG